MNYIGTQLWCLSEFLHEENLQTQEKANFDKAIGVDGGSGVGVRYLKLCYIQGQHIYTHLRNHNLF